MAHSNPQASDTVLVRMWDRQHIHKLHCTELQYWFWREKILLTISSLHTFMETLQHMRTLNRFRTSFTIRDFWKRQKVSENFLSSPRQDPFYLLCILWCSLRKWSQLGNCNSRPTTPSTSSLSHTPSRSYMVFGLPLAILRTRKFYWVSMFPLDSLNKQSVEALSNRFYRRGENKVWCFDLCCSIVWKIDRKVRFFAKHLFDQSCPTEVQTM